MATMLSNFAMNFLIYKDALESLKEYFQDFPITPWVNLQAMFY